MKAIESFVLKNKIEKVGHSNKYEIHRISKTNQFNGNVLMTIRIRKRKMGTLIHTET